MKAERKIEEIKTIINLNSLEDSSKIKVLKEILGEDKAVEVHEPIPETKARTKKSPKRPLHRGNWTKEDDKLLAHLVREKGRTLKARKEIARILGRSETSIRIRISRALPKDLLQSLPRTSRGKGKRTNSWARWLKEDDEYLSRVARTQNITSGVIRSLAKQLNRSQTSVRHRLRRIMDGEIKVSSAQEPSQKQPVRGLEKGTKLKRFTQTEIDTIYKEFFENGNNREGIAKLLGRTYSSIDNAINRLRKGELKPSKKLEKEVSVGEDTKMPRKISYFG